MNSSSELILNKRGAVYHLDLLPQEIASTIITVGDPHRVSHVSKYFDKIIVERNHREFITHTGFYKKKKLTVISTGMGADNIEIFMNELDALVNIDLQTQKVNPRKKKLNIIRLGTSGAIQNSIKVDEILLSASAVGYDSLMNFYPFQINETLQSDLQKMGWNGSCYFEHADESLLTTFKKTFPLNGITLTMPGFYAPQQRVLRLNPNTKVDFQALQKYTFQKMKVTNLEMETSAIYGFARLLGHRALSINAILANRMKQKFSKNADKTVESLILSALDVIHTL